MALACGLCVGGNYFNQPLLHSIALDLGISDAAAASTVTVAQVAYGLGLLFIVPLGDMLERRGLIVSLMTLTAVGQLFSGLAFNLTMLQVGLATAGLFSTAAQVLVPLAAALTEPERRGRAVGVVMSGLLVGILAARSVAGLLSAAGGWNTVYFVSAVIIFGVALTLWRVLPTTRATQPPGYLSILASLFVLLRQYPLLRSRSLLSALSFASVSVLFTTMALLLSAPPFNMSDVAIGLVALVGVVGAFVATWSGRLADRGKGHTMLWASVVLLVASWALLWPGETSLAWFIAGILVADAALQGIHITNQTVVYALAPEARSRINAVYMTSYFIGGASGSALAAIVWQYGRWPLTCAVGALLAFLTLSVLCLERARGLKSQSC